MNADAQSSRRTFDIVGERVVVGFLLLATAALVYVHVAVIPEQSATADIEFDFRNPMLDAEVGECVIAEELVGAGDVVCMRVVEPGVVLRTRDGPDRLGPYRNLRRTAPYLALGLRYPPSGKGCGPDAGGRQDFEVYTLNDFGMPASTFVELQGIRPMWAQRGGRHRFVYEVQVMRYGPLSGPYTIYVDPDFPVTGAVLRQYTTAQGVIRGTAFNEDPDCR